MDSGLNEPKSFGRHHSKMGHEGTSNTRPKNRGEICVSVTNQQENSNDSSGEFVAISSPSFFSLSWVINPLTLTKRPFEKAGHGILFQGLVQIREFSEKYIPTTSDAQSMLIKYPSKFVFIATPRLNHSTIGRNFRMYSKPRLPRKNVFRQKNMWIL